MPALLEAAERFQMLDMKEEVARIAVETLNLRASPRRMSWS